MRDFAFATSSSSLSAKSLSKEKRDHNFLLSVTRVPLGLGETFCDLVSTPKVRGGQVLFTDKLVYGTIDELPLN